MSSASPPATVRTIADLITSDLHAQASEPISRVVQLWDKHPGVDGMAVLGGTRVRYISRPRFFIQLGQRFGYSLFENRPVALLAEEGSTVEADMDPVEAISLATQRESGRIHDDLLVLESGRFRGLVSMRSLLTHHKSLLMHGIAERAALEESNRRLQETHREQGAFMAILIEQLRHPVTAMLGLLRGLEADAETARRHSQGLEGLLVRAREALAVVDDVQEMARLERGALQALPERFALPALIEQVVAEVTPRADGGGQRVVASCDTAPPDFATDPLLLRRILGRLLKNAADSNPERNTALVVEGTDQMLTVVVGVDTDGGPIPQAPSQLANARLATVRGLLGLLGGELEEWPHAGRGPLWVVRIPSATPAPGSTPIPQ